MVVHIHSGQHFLFSGDKRVCVVQQTESALNQTRAREERVCKNRNTASSAACNRYHSILRGQNAKNGAHLMSV